MFFSCRRELIYIARISYSESGIKTRFRRAENGKNIGRKSAAFEKDSKEPDASEIEKGSDNRTADRELLDDEALKKEIDRVKPLVDLQARLYNKEMVRHEFLDSYRRQRATYSDGTSVTVDFDGNTYKVENI